MNLIGYRGVVKGNSVVFEEGILPPEGTAVLVTPLEVVKGSPQAVLAAANTAPYLTLEDAEELLRLIEEGERPVSYEDFQRLTGLAVEDWTQ